ncbi:MAG: PIN domain-containing protein [Betaproteobacteria bacterium]|nr:PIN domain-containing protein [Betaproteobacteria bacterium]
MDIAHCLDTNVLLYAISRNPREAAKARIAREWIAREDWGVSAQALQEFYVNAVRAPQTLRHEDAVAMIAEIADSRPVAVVDAALVRQALHLKGRYGLAYWDAAIVAGAHRLGAAVLVSEDLSDGQDYAGVRVLNPFARA